MSEERFSLRLPSEVHARMSAAADAEHISMNTALIHAAKLWLAQREGSHDASPPAPDAPGSLVKVTTRRPRTRFDDGDDPEVPMPDHAVEIGRALGRLSFVLQMLAPKAKLRGGVAEECDDALAFIRTVSEYLVEDGPRPPSNGEIVDLRRQGRSLASRTTRTVIERIQ